MRKYLLLLLVLITFIRCVSGDARYYKELGKQLSASGDKQAAIEAYTKALELNPQYDTAYYNRGNAKSAIGDKKGAITDYTKAIEINPKYGEAYVNRGNAKSVLGNRKGAIADYTKAIEINPKDGDAYINRGVEKYEMGDTDGEIADYRKALDIAKEMSDASLGVDASNNLGRTLYDLKRFKEAAEAYTIGIELSPEDGKLYYGRGLARNQSGDKAGACEDFRKSYKLGISEAAVLMTLCD